MVDFLRIAKHKSLFSEVVYYTLNIGLAILLLVLAQTIHSPIVAVMLVLLSKWRVLAVRPRFWWTNIQANMVDVIVGVSVVALMYLPEVTLSIQVALTVFYILWLLVLKPQSGRKNMMLQSMMAILLGVTALYSISYEWPVFVVVLAMMIIGYSAARHFLYSYEESQMVFLSAVWGLVFAQIGWLAYYWTYSYALPGLSALRIPQVTIIVLLMSFVAERVYRSSVQNKKIVVGEIILPVIFSALLILVILLFFNSVII